MYKRILLPTDGTEFCERAIRHGIGLAKLMQAQVVGVTVTQPLHSAVPRSLIPKNLAGIIHSETAKLADEKLAVVERLAREAGVQVETVRQSNDHPWEAIVHTAKDKHCDSDRHGLARAARRVRPRPGQRNAEGVDPFHRSRAGRALSRRNSVRLG